MRRRWNGRCPVRRPITSSRRCRGSTEAGKRQAPRGNPGRFAFGEPRIADDLAWRAELACAAAWPAAETVRVGDWFVHLTDAPSRRINSASPARPDARLDLATLGVIRQVFEQAGKPAIFRVPGFLPAVDRVLDHAGFPPPVAETRTLLAARLFARSSSVEVTLAPMPDARWLAGRGALTGLTEAELHGEATRLSALRGHAAFATTLIDGAAGAIGYAVLVDHIVVLEAIVTNTRLRRRGLATAILNALMVWGADRGATAACLQVVADNAAANVLYARLGFATELYRYHYRTQG